MSAENLTEQVRNYPDIFQGGMGVAISNWRLAGESAANGAVGIVSGAAIATVFCRRLQNGEMDSCLQQALAGFGDQQYVAETLDKYYIEGGRRPQQPYLTTPVFGKRNDSLAERLNVLATYTEVRRAQIYADSLTGPDRSRSPIGINFLTKVEPPTPSSLYGAMLAGAEFIIMGAGIPADIPQALENLSRHEEAATPLNIVGASGSSSLKHKVTIDPRNYPKLAEMPLTRPPFIAIVASNSLAKFLSKEPQTAPNGFVIEGPTAGGHNAPPRGALQVDELGQPIYGYRDIVDTADFIKGGLPFWLAGGYGTPEGLIRAKQEGANGIQVGSIFALCRDSGMAPDWRDKIVDLALKNELTIVTSARASSTGYPFKIAQIAGSLSEDEVNNLRRRVCDQQLLTEAVQVKDGPPIYRCSAEPVEHYVRKFGKVADTVGRLCLCNGLLATAGLGQIRRRNGSDEPVEEPPLFTPGDGAKEAVQRMARYAGNARFSAKDVISWLRSGINLAAINIAKS